MRRFTLSLLAATAIGLVASQSASAADLGRPVYKAPPPPPPPVSDWSGVYVGVEGGYGWGDQNTSSTVPYVFPNLNGDCFESKIECFFEQLEANHAISHLSPPQTTLGKINQNGWLFGGFFGAQKQWGSWVLGIEGDIDAADIKGSISSSASAKSGFDCGGPCEDTLTESKTTTMDAKIDMLGSVRGKVGWSFAPDWLIYGTGGMAFAHVKNTFTDSNSLNYCDGEGCPDIHSGGVEAFLQGSNSLSATAGTTMFGWAAGAGVDWKWQLDPGSALVFGVEYLHYGFPDHTVTLTDNAGGSFAFNAKESVDSIKGRISYLFSIH